MRRILKIVPLIVAAVFALGACGDGTGATDDGASTGATQFPLTIKNCGRDVTFGAQPERVMTLGPEGATLVAAAGAANKIVARSTEFGSPLGEYEAQLKEIKYLSPDKELSKEKIIAQNPDLVIHYGIETQPEDLEAAGIESIAAPGRCTPRGTQGFDDIFGAIELYGRLLGTEDTAEAAGEGLRKRVEAVTEQSRKNPAGTTAAALIESLLNNDPDVLVLLSQKIGETKTQVKQALLSRKELRKLKAIKSDDIIVLFYGDTAGSPVAVEGLEKMAKQLDDLR